LRISPTPEAAVKTMTLVAKHLYFGLDPLRLRDGAERVLARVPGEGGRLPKVGLDALAEGLELDPRAGRAIVDKMVADGMLEPLAPDATEYVLTDRFRAIAQARIVEPLPRGDAQQLLTHCAEIAARFNRSATRNKYEIAAMAVYGAYMSRLTDLAELTIGITGRRRPPALRALIGRATAQTEGTAAIRAMFERRSSFLQVAFFKRIADMPRPFNVIFRAEG
jgi:hypothetical protein